MLTDKQICTFYLDRQVFGIEVSAVQEVIRYQEMTEVPLAHESVCGLINLRGQIVTAIDLRKRFGLEDRKPDKLPMNIIVRGSGGATSFLVDRIGEVREISNNNVESSPATLNGVARDLIRGAYKTDDNLILILNTERAMNVTLN
ncbi:Chemotaxis protein CheW [Rubripirellula lacrimiformis]|uniref:Chemotaxis protein CheW n=1 Tax=Rubripirellula lacrimiformis TaxID=1930273 RepID=A0A517NIH6_9BACT|nr:chemotaxis protein CheW [Rubripirellula lacrimiformis]QDT06939.1 Chemotaxis protein CheW [Rubripirellula lacrimiformis]